MSEPTYAIVEVGERDHGRVSIATVNMHSVYDKAANRAKYLEFIAMAAARGADLLVFPELSLQGYLYQLTPDWTLPAEELEYQYVSAETIPGETTQLLGEAARQHDLHIIFGMTERVEGYGGGTGCLFNTAVLLGPSGVVGTYRKVHIPAGENHVFRAGTAFPVYETPLGRVGLQICYDKCFPEPSRVYALKGADLLVMPTAYPTSGPLTMQGMVLTEEYAGYTYDIFEKCRAMENQVWFVSSDHVGVDPKGCFDFYGHSRIIHPSGVTLVEVGKEEGLAIAHGLDVKGEVLKARTKWFFGLNLLADRTPELYGDISGMRP
jgi:predicted amidohydrolase